jgi:hypothetical protein
VVLDHDDIALMITTVAAMMSAFISILTYLQEQA